MCFERYLNEEHAFLREVLSTPSPKKLFLTIILNPLNI